MSKRAKEKGGRRRRKVFHSSSFPFIYFMLFQCQVMVGEGFLHATLNRGWKIEDFAWKFQKKARRSCLPHSHHLSLEIETLAPMNLFFNFRVPFLLADSGFLCTRSTRDGWNCLFQKLSCFFLLLLSYQLFVSWCG